MKRRSRSQGSPIKRNVAKRNGQLILQALESISEPATVTKITKFIADAAGVQPVRIRESVEETLSGGVRYGFVQRVNRHYIATPVEFDALCDEIDSQVDLDEKTSDDQAVKNTCSSAHSVENRIRSGRSLTEDASETLYKKCEECNGLYDPEMEEQLRRHITSASKVRARSQMKTRSRSHAPSRRHLKK